MTDTVFINGRFLAQPLTGVQRYCRELVTSLDRLIQEEADSGLSWRLLYPKGVAVDISLQAIRPIMTGCAHGQIWEQTALPYAARNGILVSLGNSGPLCHRRHLVVIHDASVFRTPDNYGWRYATAHRALSRLLAHTAYLGTVSHFSRRELAALLNLESSMIDIVPNGADHVGGRASDPSILENLGLVGRKYLLCVGSLSPNKNLGRAVAAFHLANRPWSKMVIVGGIADNVYRQGKPHLDEHILHAGRVSDEQLIALYRNAVALVFPSVYEGFGIPPLEAMAQGCPVLASAIEPVQEVCADAATYFNPFDCGDMAAKFCLALDGGLSRKELIEKGLQRISLYSWRSSGQALRRIIDRLVRQG
jgi:glycosyltransferase involved in cell wall biosynthesis